MLHCKQLPRQYIPIQYYPHTSRREPTLPSRAGEAEQGRALNSVLTQQFWESKYRRQSSHQSRPLLFPCCRFPTCSALIPCFRKVSCARCLCSAPPQPHGQQIEQDDPAPLNCPAEAAFATLCPDLDFPVQGRQGSARRRAKKISQTLGRSAVSQRAMQEL